MTSAGAFQLDVPFGTLHGLRHGTPGGRRVLALHGWLDNAASFVPMAPELHGMDLALLDLPGHGHSAWLPPHAEYTLASGIINVLAAADALGWDRFTLLGHSMGAGIASMIAAVAPERVDALVAIEALGGLSEKNENTVSRLRDHVMQTRALDTKSLRVFPSLDAPIRARMRANQLSEDTARLLVERGVASVEGGYRWCTDPRLTLPTAVRLTEAQIDAMIDAIACPTCVIYAEPAQRYFPDALRRQRAARLHDGELHVLEGTHHLHMEHPRKIAGIIRDFLAHH